MFQKFGAKAEPRRDFFSHHEPSNTQFYLVPSNLSSTTFDALRVLLTVFRALLFIMSPVLFLYIPTFQQHFLFRITPKIEAVR